MYLLIENFNGGMDGRRMAVTSRPGTLQELINCQITRGGEIEKRKAFTKIATMPTGKTFGLHSAAGQLWTFGSDTSPTITQPSVPAVPDPLNDFIPRINYMQLQGGAVGRFTISDSWRDSTVTANTPIAVLEVTMTAHALTDSGVYDMTISAVTRPYKVKVVSVDKFQICSSAASATVVTVNSRNSTSSTSIADIGREITVGAYNVGAFTTFVPVFYSVDQHVTLVLSEYNAISGTYPIYSKTGSTLTFQSPYFNTTITKMVVDPHIQLQVGSDNLCEGGGTGIPWTYDPTFSVSLSRTLTNTAVVDSINRRTSTHGMTAKLSGNSVVLYSLAVAPGTALGPYLIYGTLYSYTSVLSSLGANMTGLVAAENYDGKIYAVAEFDGTIVNHYYNGNIVLDWDTIALSGSNESTAIALAEKISLSGKYSAIATGSVISIYFVELNTEWSVSASTINGGSTNDQTATVNTTAATSTTPQVTTVTIAGTYESGDIIKITVGGVDYAIQCGAATKGRYIKTFLNKMYSTAGSLLYFSEVDTNGGAAAFSLDTLKGSGVINLSNQDSGSVVLNAIAPYQGLLACFAEQAIQVWTMNADPRLNARSQILTNIGTYSPGSVVSQGNIDVYFLSASGVCSLKARDASNVAIVSDIGNPIADILLSDLRTKTQSQIENAKGLIDPASGRYWLAIGDRIYIYSYYPASGISAWSYFLAKSGTTQLNVDWLVSVNQRIYIRSGEDIYAYGGINGEVYDASKVTVTFPFMDAGKPAHHKTLEAIDCACLGTWSVAVGMDPLLTDVRPNVGVIENTTFNIGRIQAVGGGTHVGAQMIHEADEYAKIGNFAAHFQINDAS